MSTNEHGWDAFISHASEDKDAFVRPLANALTALGVDVWYDEFSLKIGDSLSQSIDHGLAHSNFGIVVLSPSFIGKAWPKRELQGLVAREISGRSAILPVWHQIGYDEVLDFSPPLADKVAVKTADQTASKIALQILSVVNPGIIGSRPYDELIAISSGEAFEALQSELDATKGRLDEFLCPFCGTELTESQSVPLDPEQKHWGLMRSFGCGYTETDGQTKWLCPKDENYPSEDDFDFEVMREYEEGTSHAYVCFPRPKTKHAHQVPLGYYYGPTKEAALENTKDFLRRLSRADDLYRDWKSSKTGKNG